ncbi:surface-adhesin E family protein [Acinetobacter sp. CAAS 2-6]|uniref:surface-adhesin E family protein n=1 Tax=Acinetobacter sp. CAAS 2-6 TaxID=3016358 RepID=UPI002DD6B131|nr:surface-adhesin E family protein [Acinetobacter sp. CAAS 2-6]
MKKILLICGLLTSGFSFGADWVFITESADADADYYIDKSHYKYNSKTGEVEVWYKRNQFEGLNEYTESKTLNIFDCINKREKTIALVSYTYTGQSNQIITKPTPYSVVFPDTIGEDLWIAACKTKGKGLYLPYKPNFISEKRMKLLGIEDGKKAP